MSALHVWLPDSNRCAALRINVQLGPARTIIAERAPHRSGALIGGCNFALVRSRAIGYLMEAMFRISSVSVWSRSAAHKG